MPHRRRYIQRAPPADVKDIWVALSAAKKGSSHAGMPPSAGLVQGRGTVLQGSKGMVTSANPGSFACMAVVWPLYENNLQGCGARSKHAHRTRRLANFFRPLCYQRGQPRQ
jgi:hypothetical protein